MSAIHVTTDRTMGSERFITARRCGEIDEVRFIGPSVPGYPGPTFLAFGDGWVHVTDPERFGESFGPSWVAAFLEPTKAGERLA